MPLRYLILVPAFLIIFVLAMVVWILYYPTGPATSMAQPPPATQQAKPELVADPGQTPALADAAGQDAFTANCLNCHSARYVLMQPRFPRKVWKAEVTKMVEAYKASIPAPQQEQIVNYLTVGYGTEDNT